MKRWQTRGEVQDSDEEEISLDVESQRLDHPPKRIKVVNDVGQKDKQDKQDERQATPDAQPDGDVNPAKSHAETTETTGVAVQSPGHTSAGIITPGGKTGQEEDNEPAWTTRTNAKTYGRLRGISGGNAVKTRELFPVVTQAEQDAVDATTLEMAYDLPSSSILPEDPVAPSKDHARSAQPIQANEPVISSPQAGDPFSRASSPLSELSNPPDSPPEFLRLPDSTLAQSQTGPGQTSVASPINAILALTTMSCHQLCSHKALVDHCGQDKRNNFTRICTTRLNINNSAESVGSDQSVFWNKLHMKHRMRPLNMTMQNLAVLPQDQAVPRRA